MNWAALLTGNIGAAVSEAYQAYEARKQREKELEDAKHERRIEVIKQGHVNEATWNLKAIENAGWRDEWLTILLSLPLILVFGPDVVQAQVKEGFVILGTLPDWYKGGIALMIASAFGYQKFLHYKMTDTYSLPKEEEKK